MSVTSTNLVDLVAGYSAYTDVEQLNVQAAVDAPATTPVCASAVAVSAASSGWCASGAAGASAGATYQWGC